MKEVKFNRSPARPQDIVKAVVRRVGRVEIETTPDGTQIHTEHIGKGVNRIIVVGGFMTPGWQFLRAAAKEIAQKSDATVVLVTTPKKWKINDAGVNERVTSQVSRRIDREIDAMLQENPHAPIAGWATSFGARAMLRSAQIHPELKIIGLNVPAIEDELPNLSGSRRAIRVEYGVNDKRVKKGNIMRFINEQVEQGHIVEVEANPMEPPTQIGAFFLGLHTRVGAVNVLQQSFTDFVERYKENI